VLAGESGDVLEGLEHARRCLTVDHRHQPGATTRERRGDPLGCDHPAPLLAHRDDLGAAALGDLDQQQAEAPALAHDHAITWLDQRGDGRLQPGPAGAGDGKRARVVRLEGEAAQLHHLGHDRGELGVEVAQQRRRHRAQHAWVGHGRPGTEQEAGAG
jgi:hypothetical protein